MCCVTSLNQHPSACKAPRLAHVGLGFCTAVNESAHSHSERWVGAVVQIARCFIACIENAAVSAGQAYHIVSPQVNAPHSHAALRPVQQPCTIAQRPVQQPCIIAQRCDLGSNRAQLSATVQLYSNRSATRSQPHTNAQHRAAWNSLPAAPLLSQERTHGHTPVDGHQPHHGRTDTQCLTSAHSLHAASRANRLSHSGTSRTL